MAEYAEPERRIVLRFKDQRAIRHVSDPIHRDLSAAARCGEALFLSCDETAGVDRLTADGEDFGNHVHFSLGDLMSLPDGPAGEMDIEGLDGDGDWLWITGSHSLKRGKADIDENKLVESLREMAAVERDPNRFFLARVPLVQRDGGPEPVARDGDRRIAHVKLHARKSKLKKWLRKDVHLGPFLDLPCKENGFDIEGIAARGLRVWLGLRGPVLRGWALILEFEIKLTGRGHLKARRIDGKRRYRKHFIDAAGMGVRDISIHGDDLLVLTGPTMAGDGQCRVLRWKNALSCRETGFHRSPGLETVQEIPYRSGVDHAEGLVRWDDGAWIVVYDSPAGVRLEGDGARVTADVFRWA